MPRLRRSDCATPGIARRRRGRGFEYLDPDGGHIADLGFFRIGSDDYAERNESYGLTTMLRKHVTLSDGGLVFDFPAKSGQRRIQTITDHEVMQVVTALKRRRGGSQLLAYWDATERWVEVHSDEVNRYIKRHAGGEFSAKDFRTWNATVLAAVALAAKEHVSSRAQRERNVRGAIETVAAYLGNTPAVCRASYVDPRVIDRYRAGVTISATLGDLPAESPDLSKPRARKRIENAVLDLLGSPGTALRTRHHPSTREPRPIGG
jgi:DNA topoisomerase I